MKVGWLSDYNKKDLLGGASISNSLMIKEGEDRGHTIVFQDYKTFNQEELEDMDLVVLSNINMFQKKHIQWVIDNKPFVKYEHDYCFCKFRNVRCEEQCPVICKPAEIFEDLFMKSKLNIFISKLQQDIYNRFFNNLLFRNALILPPPIDTKLYFADKKLQKKDTYLYLGLIAEHKGVAEIIEEGLRLKQLGKTVVFAGKGVHKVLMERIKENFKYLGEIEHEDVPKLLRQYQHFFVAPKMRETFGIVVLEAILSGCNIVRFKNSKEMGIDSYRDIKTIVELGNNSKHIFWNKIEGCDYYDKKN